MIDKEQEQQRIGQMIADTRRQQGMTQQDLADRTGLQRNHISRIEQGRYNVGAVTLAQLADAMGKQVTLTDKQ